MHHDAFQDWKRERDAIEQEMKLFLAAGRRAPLEDRAVRQIQFAAPIERRNAAARNLLTSVRAARPAPPIAAGMAEQVTKPADAQTATVLQLSASPPIAAELPKQGTEPAGAQTSDVLPLSASPPTAVELAGMEPAAVDRVIDALFEDASDDAFNFNLPQSSSSACSEDRALSCEDYLSDGRSVEAQRYPRVARRRDFSAVFKAVAGAFSADRRPAIGRLNQSSSLKLAAVQSQACVNGLLLQGIEGQACRVSYATITVLDERPSLKVSTCDAVPGVRR
jgi:hypothetical protein